MGVRHHVVGIGRWGGWLARRLGDLGERVATLTTSRPDELGGLARRLEARCYAPGKRLPVRDRDLVWLCVPDDALRESLVAHAERYAGEEVCLVIASGGASLPALTADVAHAVGVLWPVQSISLAQEPNWQQLPLVVQSGDAAFAKTLLQFAQRISGLPPKPVADDRERQLLHLGAVVTQNFANHLWELTASLYPEHPEDWRLLLPLAHTYLDKLDAGDPRDLQTGPAVRGDAGTLETHERLLREGGHERLLALYRALSASISMRG